MDIAIQVRMLLAARQISLRELAEKMDPPTSAQNIGQKLKKNSFTDHDLHAIAKVCDATYFSGFVLNDTGTKIE